ncbi:acyltransferase family protein [Butyrivibrio sp. MC2013]|uniref:acyltransferase family protein n=1 Tax=Butyrivibrio sp. MC2013 TaxID=1280686 RepID=UPI00041A07C4|nr:acyltransferase family protein [Butyrivibrio sp. MC2013]
MNSKRIYALDIAKAISIYLVVLAHLLRDGPYFAYIVPATIPVFFILSGVSYRPSGSFPAFLSKKARALIKPYLFAGIISICIYRIMGSFAGDMLREGGGEKSFMSNILELVYANAKHDHMKWNNSLWFLPCFFVLLIIAEIYERYILPLICSNKESLMAIVSRLIFSFLTSGLAFILSGFVTDLRLPWHIEGALYAMPFFQIGIILRPYIYRMTGKGSSDEEGAPSSLGSTDPSGKADQGRALLSASISFIFFFAIGIFLGLINGETSARTDEYGLYPALYYFSGISFAISFISFGSIIKDRIPDISFVGRNTLPVLLWNKFPVLLIQLAVPGFLSLIRDPGSPIALMGCLLPAIIVIMACLVFDSILKAALELLTRSIISFSGSRK